MLLLFFSLGCAPPLPQGSARPSPAETTRGVWTVARLVASDADTNDYFGTDVTPAGDVDGDGLPDIAVSASQGEQVYLYYGSVSGYSTADEQILTTTTLTNRFANSISAGDFDADGFTDLAASAHEDSDSAITAGAAALFVGSAAGLSSTDDLRPTSSAAQQQFSYDLGTGDFNGDGYADLVSSAHGDSSAGTYAGAAYTYYGSATGLSTASEQQLVASDALMWDSFGFSLRRAGDVNGDGYDDLIVGAAGVDPVGAAYVYYGSATGLATATEAHIPPGDPANDSAFGFTVSGAGDVNNDGYDDVMVSTYDFFSPSAVYVYHGSAAGIGTSPAQRIVASDVGPSELFGLTHTGAGDVDRDGYADVVISAMLHNGGAGAAYVYYGSATGLATASEDKLTATSGSSAGFGSSVAAGGDLNGDGIDDVLIGASSDELTGSVYVFYGSCTDGDSDGLCQLDDCDDADPTVGPPLSFYADTDDDGYGNPGDVAEACTPPSGYTADATDCDDTNPATNPDTAEICDAADNDCDDEIDEDVTEIFYADADADGFGDANTSIEACTPPSGHVDDDTDCNDTDDSIYPGAEEIAGDGIDQDCDGADQAADVTEAPDSGIAAVDPAVCRGMGWSCASAPRSAVGWLVVAGLLGVLFRRRVAVIN